MSGREQGSAGWLLALDTSSDRAGVALTNGERTAELSWDASRNQTATLLSAADQLLRLEGLSLDDLRAIAVATGPGAFTSLRVGMSTAKGLAFARRLPLFGVPTLDGAARPFADAGLETIAVVTAGRGRLVWASYGQRGGLWEQLAAPRNGDLAAMAEEIRQGGIRPTVTGELRQEQVASVREAGAIVPPAMLRERRIVGVAAIAWERFTTGDPDDAATLTPVYLHAAAATSTGVPRG